MWQPEMAEKSSRQSCLVKYCGLGIIAQAADPDCEVVAGNSNRNSRLLRWESLRENTFYTNLTAKTRQTFKTFETFIVCGI